MTLTPIRFLASMIPALLAAWQHAAAQDARPLIGQDSLQRIVNERVRAGKAPALIVGVVGPNGERMVASAGEARPGVPVSEATVFEIGSITKAFTAVVLADMVQRGEVRLDQPVSDLLPAGTRVPSLNGKVITLGHLAMQNSGLPRLPDNLRPANMENPYADYTVAQLYEFLSRHQLRREPGAQYEYSNLGVGLLGHALALRAGVSYEALVRERVLEPLGMSATGITVGEAMRRQAANGHTADGDVTAWWDLPTLAGAGALRSSLADMMRFLAANLGPGDTPVGRAIAATHQPQFPVNGTLTMGLNWHIVRFGADTMVFHNGGTGGFRTLVAWSPRRRTGVVLLGSMSFDNEDIARHVLFGAPLAQHVARQEVVLPDDELASYVGRYELAPTFVITVTRDGKNLFAQPTGQPRVRLFAAAKDLLFLKVVAAELEFSRDASGAVTGLTLVQNGARSFGRKLPD